MTRQDLGAQPFGGGHEPHLRCRAVIERRGMRIGAGNICAGVSQPVQWVASCSAC
jgi:hypothetical protein